MPKEFIGYSSSNDFGEALSNAIRKAKTGLTTDYVRWTLADVVGEAGGFVLTTDLYVSILAEGANERQAIGPAHFEVIDASEKPFVIKLVSAAQIEFARRVLNGEETYAVHVQGEIVSTPADYNPGWRFHLAPASITFFGDTVEVCDATCKYVEDHLEDVGTDFLPDGIWCPWSSTLVSEISVDQVSARMANG